MQYINYGRLLVMKLFILTWLIYGSLATISYAQVDDNYDCQAQESTIIKAARRGNLDLIKNYDKAGCKIPKQDKRGFTLYDLAALNSDEDTMAWLVNKGYAQEGHYSTRMYKLVQTGLRFLNFDAGVINGKMNAATKEGIIDFQKANKLKQTGEISVSWLSFFERKLIKKTQATLANLGYSAGDADGIIGPNTRTAMQAFRQERSMPEQDYGYIDDQLIYQIMMAENEATKQQIARREAERAARIKAQQAAKQQEIAKRRAKAQKEAEKARQQAEAAASEAEAQRLAKEKRLLEERTSQASSNQITLKEKNEQTDSSRTKTELEQLNKQSESTQTQQQMLKDKMGETTQAQSEKEVELGEQAQIEEQRRAQIKAEQAKQAAEDKLQAEKIAQQKAKAARRAEEIAKAKALAAEREASKAKTQAQKAFKAARSGQSVPVSPDVQIGKPIQSNTSHVLKPGGRFNQLSGKLKFVRDGKHLSQCLIGNQVIDKSWCEPYYPSGENKQCDAVVSRTGVVVSLLCK